MRKSKFLFILIFSPSLLWGKSLVDTTRQMILVEALEASKHPARVYLLERVAEKWALLPKVYPAVIGIKGVATGIGFEGDPVFAVENKKQEGDRKSPTGIFPLGFVYGKASNLPFESKLSYRQLREDLIGVDDSNSQYYNQIISTLGPNAPAKKDWRSFEKLLRKDDIYKWFVEINYNPERVKGAGSLIFLHVWKRPNSGTAACAALEENSLLNVMKWLEPSKNPFLVFLPPGKKKIFLKSLGLD